ncbi:MAG: potassium-transporting ATPase subunit KdpC [Bulleidia sp.]
MKKFGFIGKAAGMVLAMTLVCGVIYTAAITGLSQLFFPEQANGSVIEVDGRKYGSELLAQQFTGEEYMWGRIMNLTMVIDQDGNAKVYSGPSNLSPESEEYRQLVEERVDQIKEADPYAQEEKIPEDLVTCSGSGLDPDVSLAAAEYQIPRISKVRGMSQDQVENIIEACTTHRILGVFGEDHVNVLKVNLMLDGILK